MARGEYQEQDWEGVDDPAYCARCGQPAPPTATRCPACRNILRLTRQLHLWAFLVVTALVFLIRLVLGTHLFFAALVSAVAGLGAMTFFWLLQKKKLWPYRHGWRYTWAPSTLAGIAVIEGGGIASLPDHVTPHDFIAYGLVFLPLGLIVGLMIPLIAPYHYVNLLFRTCSSCGATANMRMRYCWRCGELLPETPITVS